MDARQKKSRAKIIASLADLLKRRELDEITFSEIANHAGISRQTLHTHFESKSAILKGYMDDWFASISDITRRKQAYPTANPKDVMVAVLAELIRNFGKDFQVRRAIISGRGGPDALETYRGFVHTMMGDYIARRGIKLPKDDVYLISIFVSLGFAGLTDAWGDGTLQVEPKDLGAKVANLVESILSETQIE